MYAASPVVHDTVFEANTSFEQETTIINFDQTLTPIKEIINIIERETGNMVPDHTKR